MMLSKEVNSVLKDIVIAVDPGREKCGVAVVQRPHNILFKGIVPTETLSSTVQGMVVQYRTFKIVLGNGTFSNVIQQRLQSSKAEEKIEIISINEYRSTDLAKIRYWQENPPPRLAAYLAGYYANCAGTCG